MIEMSLQQIMKEAIVEYITKNPGIDSIDIVSHFRLTPDVTLEAVSELVSSGVIEYREVYGNKYEYHITDKQQK